MAGVFSVSVSWKRQYGRRDPRLAAMKNDYMVEVFFKPDVVEPPRVNEEGEQQNSEPPKAGELAKWLMEDGVGEKKKVWDVWGEARKKYSKHKWRNFVYSMIPKMIQGGSIQNIYQGYMKFAQIVKLDFISAINSIWRPKLEHKTVLNKMERGIATGALGAYKPLIESGTMRGAVWVRVRKIPPNLSKTGLPEGYYESESTEHRGQWPSWIWRR